VRRLGTTLGWTLVTALLFGGILAPPPPAGAQEGTPTVEGRVNALNAATGALTVATTGLTTNGETVVSLNGARVSLSDLVVGETARALYDPGTSLAREISVNRPEGWLWGRITAYSAPTPGANATLTFQRRGGASEVLVVGPASVIPVEDGGDITSLVGVDASVAFDPVTKIISRLNPYVPEPSEPDSEPYPAPAPTPDALPEPTPVPEPVRYRVEGVVAAVDPTAGTLTLTGRCVRAAKAKQAAVRHRGPQSLVLSVAAGTDLWLDGTPAGLADLAAGDRVRCLYETAGDQNRALQVRALMPPVRVAAGLVRGVGAGTVAIGSIKRPCVLTVTDTTSVSVDGVPAAFGQLAIGQRGVALYRERGGVTAALVVVTMSPPAPRTPAKKKAARR
jgi:hypothetical protein